MTEFKYGGRDGGMAGRMLPLCLHQPSQSAPAGLGGLNPDVSAQMAPVCLPPTTDRQSQATASRSTLVPVLPRDAAKTRTDRAKPRPASIAENPPPLRPLFRPSQVFTRPILVAETVQHGPRYGPLSFILAAFYLRRDLDLGQGLRTHLLRGPIPALPNPAA